MSIRPRAITMALTVIAALSGCTTGPEPKNTVDCPIDYAALKAMESDLIRQGMEVFRTVDEEHYSDSQRQLLDQTRSLLESRIRPVDPIDIEIIDRAREILSDESIWDRDDDRVCEAGDRRFGLYCALYFASEQLIGEYDHRRTGLQEVRFALQDATAGKDYDHRLRDFNNDPDTTLEDVHAVLATARAVVQQRLADQAACRLQPTLN